MDTHEIQKGGSNPEYAYTVGIKPCLTAEQITGIQKVLRLTHSYVFDLRHVRKENTAEHTQIGIVEVPLAEGLKRLEVLPAITGVLERGGSSVTTDQQARPLSELFVERS